jgi:uncharacterized protein YciI
MKRLVLLTLIAVSFASTAQSGSYTFVFLNKKTDADKIAKEESEKLMQGHMANIQRLAGEKKLLAAGPFEGGGGIFIFNTTSVDTVAKWIETDPAVRAKRWNVEILPYQPLVGGICPVGEKYEMTMYQFIRFWPEIKKFTVADAPQLILQHEQYWKNQHNKNALVTLASFGGDDGDILITATPIDETILVDDPAIRTGLIQFEKRKIYIAKGSFCEPK